MLSGSGPAAAAIERTVSVTAIPSNSGSASTAGACPMKRPWVAAAKILAPASRQRRPALQRRASADQIIEDDHRSIAHLADEELAGDDPTAAPFFDERCRRLVMQFCGEGSAKLLGALGAADVGRDDGDFFMPQQSGEVLDKERYRLEIGRRAVKSVLEGGHIVDVEGHHRVRSTGLEEPCHIFGRDRVAGLRPPVLAGVAKVGDDCRYALGAGVFQRADEEQQAAELVVWALLGIPVQRVHHEHILSAHLDERTDLVLAVLERALLMRAEDQLEVLRDSLAIIPGAFDRKHGEPTIH
jgi:hypothetical protein